MSIIVVVLVVLAVVAAIRLFGVRRKETTAGRSLAKVGAEVATLLQSTPVLSVRKVVVVPKVSADETFKDWCRRLGRRLTITAEEISAVGREIGVVTPILTIGVETKVSTSGGAAVVEEEGPRTWSMLTDNEILHDIVEVAIRRKMAAEWGFFRRIPTPEPVINLPIPEWVSCQSYDQSATMDTPEVFMSEVPGYLAKFVASATPLEQKSAVPEPVSPEAAAQQALGEIHHRGPDSLLTGVDPSSWRSSSAS